MNEMALTFFTLLYAENEKKNKTNCIAEKGKNNKTRARTSFFYFTVIYRHPIYCIDRTYMWLKTPRDVSFIFCIVYAHLTLAILNSRIGRGWNVPPRRPDCKVIGNSANIAPFQFIPVKSLSWAENTQR